MMNHLITVLILTIVGALIGWITNILAIKLLFRPLKPIKIPFTPFVILGLIPKRRAELAKVIAEVVAHELISVDEMLEEAIKDEDLQGIKGYVKRKIKVVISEKISIIPFPFKSMIQAPIDQMIEMEVDQGLDDIIINIKDIVRDNLSNHRSSYSRSGLWQQGGPHRRECPQYRGRRCSRSYTEHPCNQ